jgi:aminoglycoside phosphotransferase (APT) family kinase protein
MYEYHPPRISYGPFNSRLDFNEGVVLALRNSRPDSSQYNRSLETEILASRGDEIVFSHGDLGQGNIIFNEGKITIIDWGAAGYSLEEREFVEAKWRAFHDKAWDRLINLHSRFYTTI